jgi:hypothetical protein
VIDPIGDRDALVCVLRLIASEPVIREAVIRGLR